MYVDMIRYRFRAGILFLGIGFLTGCQGEANDGSARTKYTGAMVLAMSWQAGFCETRPRLPECKSQKSDRFDASHFSLHGLWPQPGNNVYCDVEEADVKKDKNRKWKQLAGLGLSNATKKSLWKIMPGARSFLHRHEWIKHGTCYSASAETYYQDSLALMEVINGSSVQSLFETNIGRPLTNAQIRQEFDRAFGKGVGKRVRVSCKRDGAREIITEITLGLKGEVSDNLNLAKLALNSNPTKPGCPRGIVDAVGLQ